MIMKKILSGMTSLALSLTMLAGIDTVRPEVQANAATTSWKFDLGATTESGYTSVGATYGYTSDRGYGFSNCYKVENQTASGSGALSDAVRFTEGGGATFNANVPTGLYEVKIYNGNVTRMSVQIEGMQQIMNITGNGNSDSVIVSVTDGVINIGATPGRSGWYADISEIDITQISTDTTYPKTVWFCGDSTVCNYYPKNTSTQAGWGQVFDQYIDSSWQVRNMATSGQYAKGFVDNGQFEPIKTYGKTGDLFIISIGINDTNYSNADEYTTYVSQMVTEAKAKGMKVILVKQQGRHADLNRSPLLTGRWFGGQLDAIGAAQNVPVMDLFTPWQEFGLTLGYDGMNDYYMDGDDLHPNRKGAMKLAEIAANLIDWNTLGLKGDAEPAVMDESAYYMFKNVNSGLYMEVEGGTAANGTNVQQWGADSASAHNTWKLKAASDGYYYIYSMLGGGETYLLDLANGSATNGTNIQIYSNTSSDAQLFRFYENSDGSYTITTKNSTDSSAVEIVNAYTTSGANVQEWERNGATCQNWNAEKVSYTVPVTTTTVTTTTTTARPLTTATSIVTVTQPAESQKVLVKDPGEVNGDGTVSVADPTLIMQFLANPDNYGPNGVNKIDEQGMKNADVVDNDGVNAIDALAIQKYCAGSTELPPKEYEETPAYTVVTSIVYITETTTTAPPATTTDISENVYYAIDAVYEDGVTETTNGGFAGTAYVNLANNNTSNITWIVDVPAGAAGSYYVNIRMANGTDADRMMKIIVNGDTNNYWMQSFTGTGAWTTWADRGIVLPMKAGTNTIQLISATANGGPNLDYITLTKTDEPVAEYYVEPVVTTTAASNDPVIYIAGDSTVQSYSSSARATTGGPIQGWGYFLNTYFNDKVSVVNRAIAGRSSKSFYDQGRFTAIEESLKAGDYVLIQFAINDSASSNAERYAPVCNNVDNPTSGSYEWYMTQFITAALAKGATPILVTTTLSAKSYSNGKFVGSYTDYCNACKSLAAKYSIPCVDLNTLMVNHYNSVGYDTAYSYHMASVIEGSTDLTHFNDTGANIVAGLVANAIKGLGIPLSSYVK